MVLAVLALVLAVAATLLARSTLSVHRRKRTTVDERVLVLGASSGIGEHLAHLYAKRGARLLLVARRESLLKKVQQTCCRLGAKSTDIMVSDVTSLVSLQALRVFVEKLGGVDTTVVCIGVLTITPFHALATSDTSDTIIYQAFKTNTFAPIRIAKEFLPLLRVSHGNLIVISSTAGLLPAPTRALYCASKHALHGFFDSLQIEERLHDVFICLVCPGTVSTDFRDTALDKDLWNVGMGQGTQKGAISALQVAKVIQIVSDNRSQHCLVIPRWYSVMVLLRAVAPSLVDWLAAKKYGYSVK